MIFRRYHTAAGPELDESCLDDAIQEALNDSRFDPFVTRCECCQTHIPDQQARTNPWFVTLCPNCLDARPCNRCGTPLLPSHIQHLDGEEYCTPCLQTIQATQTTNHPQ